MLRYAQITGWGKYAPPLLMTNDDMAKIVDTSDEWIFSRSGIRQRHYSHISTGDMAWSGRGASPGCRRYRCR